MWRGGAETALFGVRSLPRLFGSRVPGRLSVRGGLLGIAGRGGLCGLLRGGTLGFFRGFLALAFPAFEIVIGLLSHLNLSG